MIGLCPATHSNIKLAAGLKSRAEKLKLWGGTDQSVP
jgi:hypothetical protein